MIAALATETDRRRPAAGVLSAQEAKEPVMKDQGAQLTIRCSSSAIYPQGGIVEMDLDGSLRRLSWQDGAGNAHRLSGLTYEEDRGTHHLSADAAVGDTAGDLYLVDIWMHESRGMYRCFAFIEPASGNGSDPGDLSGTWGADAPHG
jgi:hypothetical protein